MMEMVKSEFDHYRLTVGVTNSEDLYAGLSRNKYDAVIVKRLKGDHTGAVMTKGDIVWMASEEFEYNPNEPLPLVSLAAPCSLRQLSINGLNANKIAWQETFVGTDASIVSQALKQNFGATVLERANLPDGCKILPDEYGLPQIPDSENVLEATSAAKRNHALLLDAIIGIF